MGELVSGVIAGLVIAGIIVLATVYRIVLAICNRQ